MSKLQSYQKWICKFINNKQMAFLLSFVSQQLLFYFQNIWIQWRMRWIVGRSNRSLTAILCTDYRYYNNSSNSCSSKLFQKAKQIFLLQNLYPQLLRMRSLKNEQAKMILYFMWCQCKSIKKSYHTHTQSNLRTKISRLDGLSPFHVLTTLF